MCVRPILSALHKAPHLIHTVTLRHILYPYFTNSKTGFQGRKKRALYVYERGFQPDSEPPILFFLIHGGARKGFMYLFLFGDENWLLHTQIWNWKALEEVNTGLLSDRDEA